MNIRARLAPGAMVIAALLQAGVADAEAPLRTSGNTATQALTALLPPSRVAQSAPLQQCTDQCAATYQSCLQKAPDNPAQKDRCFAAWAQCNQGCNAYRR